MVEYNSGVMQSFETRLLSRRRNDFQRYLDYWFINEHPPPDSFQLLAYTGAALPRDGFRFVPVFDQVGVVEFITEIVGARYNLQPGLTTKGDKTPISIGEPISFRPEPTNEHDPQAVEVLRTSDGQRIGYVMRGLARQIRQWDATIDSAIARINGTEQRPTLLARVRAEFT